MTLETHYFATFGETFLLNNKYLVFFHIFLAAQGGY